MAKAKLNAIDAMAKWMSVSDRLIQPNSSQVEQSKKPKLKLTKKQRAIIREMFGGRCTYCGYELSDKGWHADHAKPIMRYGNDQCHYPENDVIENMVPACRSCNIYKGDANIEEFRQIITRQLQNSINRTQCLRTGQRLGILQLKATPIVFWFEKYGEMENAGNGKAKATKM
ncbi:HNH endonuclease [Xenorhabdus beddingii]|uniref:HNH endonuclease n=1 Tax=Xenorhabdus beddingii TaxID=40578 RepID=A0A1Y2S8Z4_9GAMM|nr:HNH endonuclease signature motif containing protein [Xenorhabdus beddingii]OTA13968.1 HNH endonuclease [Xenorhabdus beddingii]